MSKEYTMDEIRKLAETDPKKLEAEYQSARKATASIVQRARAGLAARTPVVPANKFVAWAQGYGERHIHTGSARPVAHMMLILGLTGCGIEYWCHHRHAHAHKKEDDHH